MTGWIIWLLRTVDTLIGWTVAFAWHLVNILPTQARSSSSKPLLVRHIVVIKLWAIGESVLTLPALGALARACPQATLCVLTTKYVAPIYEGQPSVTTVATISPHPLSLMWYVMRHWRAFDVAIDAEPYLYTSAIVAGLLGKSSFGFATRRRGELYTQSVLYHDQQHVAQTYLDLVAPLCGKTILTSLIPLRPTAAHQRSIDEFLHYRNLVSHKLVVIAPSVGGSAKSRRWPSSRFGRVAESLVKRQGMQIIILGAPGDSKLVHEVRKKISDTTVPITHFSLLQVAALLQRCRLLIANDSGLMHVGAAMNTPTLGLFGPNLPLRFRPFNARSKYLYHPCPNSPHIHVHRGKISAPSCACMKNITTQEVVRTAAKMLAL